MRMMDAIATERFNQLLREWRKQGKHISWEQLNQAARIAQEEQEARQAAEQEEQNGSHRTA